MTNPPRYVPLDLTLSTPRIRLLRALRWFDWVRSEDLLDAVDVPDVKSNRTMRNTYAAALQQNVKRGLTDRRPVDGVSEYRITAKGRRALAQMAADYESRLQGAIA